jgi:hypothetical protein
MLSGRVFEHTADDLKQHLKPDGVLAVDRLLNLPTLFMAERGAEGDQLARVGSLTRIRPSYRTYDLEYTFDPAVPPIRNGKIEELARQLDIDAESWEFSRTHWAVKDVDLYRVLVQNVIARRLTPSVFRLSDEPVNDQLISVMMPFAPEFDDVYEALQAAARDLGKEARRADDIWKHEAIIQDVVYLLSTSSSVICDLSRQNSNVFYEAGIAHTLDKNVILIAQSDEDVPFNLRHLRYIVYRNDAEGRGRLSDQVRERLRQLSAA